MYKNNCYIKSLLVVALSLGACHDELLNPVPESVLTTANAFNDAKGLDLAVLGIYNAYQSRLPTDYELMETPSDNMYGYYFAVSPGMSEIALLEVNPENPKLNSFWKSSYNGIFRANTVLHNIDNPDDYGESQKKQFVGEAKFMRAMFYFDLVRIFGGVPLVKSILTYTQAKEIPRASEQEIYDLIIEDLKEAIANLPEPDLMKKGRASKAAAISLLAKVYVYRENWKDSKSYLEQLFTDYNFSLVKNYRDLFSTETENNSETIYAITYVSGTNGHNLTYNLSPSPGIYGTGINNGNEVARPTWSLQKAYEDGDSRFKVTVTQELFSFASKPGDDPVWFPYFNKWIVPLSVPSSSGLDIPVLRLADMVLLYAEALYHTGDPSGALAQINKIRERAFGNTSHNYTLEDISTEEAFLEKLLLERRLELSVENNRWFDLVRTGKFTSVLTTLEGEYNPTTGKAIMIPINAKPYMKYFPIPWEQIQLASPGVLVQNDGYN